MDGRGAWPSHSDVVGFQGRCRDPALRGAHNHSHFRFSRSQQADPEGTWFPTLGGPAVPVWSRGVPRFQDCQCKTRRALGKPRQVGPPHLGSLSPFTDRRELLPELPVFKCSSAMAGVQPGTVPIFLHCVSSRGSCTIQGEERSLIFGLC